jgi:hypothetical protein
MRIENISNVVILIRPDAPGEFYRDVTPPPESFETAVVREFAPTTCDSQSCRLAPGGSLQYDGPAPVRVLLDYAPADTVSAVLVNVLVSELGSRLRSPGSNAVRRVASCVSGVQSTLEGDQWEEVFRYAATTAPGCKSLLDDAVGSATAERESLATRLINSAKKVANGAWVDALLALEKAAVAH